MNKSGLARTVGFIGALGASAALVAAGVSTTGAYFTDSKDGSINASTGSVKVNTSNLKLNFDGLLPGKYQTKRIDYTATGTGPEDIWLVFPTDGSANAFLQAPHDGSTPLGRYGHLAVTSNAGSSFVSNNLSVDPDGYDTSASCYVDNEGRGGSATEAANPSDRTVPYCAPRPAILLQSNMNRGDKGFTNIEFGFTKILSDPSFQGNARALVANFTIVATQAGIRPDDPSNPATPIPVG